jgi:uncharacterized protein YqeY
MSLHQEIKDQVKEAMKSREELKLSVVRGLIAGFTNELVSKKRKPDELLSDEEVLTVIKRQANQRKDSIEQFRAGGREDLATKEEAELAFLDAYLPQMMSREEVRKIAENKQKELGLSSKTDAGKLMSALMKDLKGMADGADVKAVVDELLS